MDWLAERGGCPVILGRRNGDHAQYAHVVDPLRRRPDCVEAGTLLPLASCAIGQILLAAETDADVRRLMHRLNAETRSPAEIVRIPELIARVTEIRQRGYVLMVDQLCAVLATRLPPAVSATPLVLGMTGERAALAERAPALVSMIREEIPFWLNSVRRDR